MAICSPPAHDEPLLIVRQSSLNGGVRANSATRSLALNDGDRGIAGALGHTAPGSGRVWPESISARRCDERTPCRSGI
jgi:hypothetical protein